MSGTSSVFPLAAVVDADGIRTTEDDVIIVDDMLFVSFRFSSPHPAARLPLSRSCPFRVCGWWAVVIVLLCPQPSHWHFVLSQLLSMPVFYCINFGSAFCWAQICCSKWNLSLFVRFALNRTKTFSIIYWKMTSQRRLNTTDRPLVCFHSLSFHCGCANPCTHTQTRNEGKNLRRTAKLLHFKK